ncbi:hypothetical protein CWR43_04220 [Rhizobium sullae]|uniref:Uncharacterized protein n=1 Tax=Rhizobium sullae TaxID=50338 RepID=A0A2N0DG05_RHISU|nr:hypothetical protein CWR43_04220 [Rhizobium sullae]
MDYGGLGGIIVPWLRPRLIATQDINGLLTSLRQLGAVPIAEAPALESFQDTAGDRKVKSGDVWQDRFML